MQNTVVLSANMYSNPERTDNGKSFVNTMNSVGPSTDPWGMLMDTRSISDLVPFSNVNGRFFT